MKAVICDRCKNVFIEPNYAEVEVVMDIGIGISKRKFDICRECKKWLYKEFGVKEEWEEKE